MLTGAVLGSSIGVRPLRPHPRASVPEFHGCAGGLADSAGYGREVMENAGPVGFSTLGLAAVVKTASDNHQLRIGCPIHQSVRVINPP